MTKPLLLSRFRELAIRSIGRWTNVIIRPEELLSLVVRTERAESALEEAQALLDKMDREGLEAFGASRDNLQNTLFIVFAARNETLPEPSFKWSLNIVAIDQSKAKDIR